MLTPARGEGTPVTTVVSLVWRWALLGGFTLLAFAPLSGRLLAGDLAAGATLGYLPAVVGYAVFTAVAIKRRGRPVVQIHDRETDAIVGGLLLVVAIAAVVLIEPALAQQFYLWRFDLLTVWLFALGAAILLFGLRKVLEFREAWLTLLLIWPLPTRLITLTVGRGAVVATSAQHLLVVLIVLCLGRRPGERASWAAPVAGSVVGVSLLVTLPMQQTPLLIVVPPTAAGLAAMVVWASLRRLTRTPWPHVATPVVRRPFASAVVIGLAGLLGLWLVPGPPPRPVVNRPVAAATADPVSMVPPGWRAVRHADLPGQRRNFGPSSRSSRWVVQAQDAAAAPGAVDPDGTPRAMVVDQVVARRTSLFELFTVPVTYATSGVSFSEPRPVELGSGVRGALYSAVDADSRLTWTVLTVTLALPAPLLEPGAPANQTRYERITFITVDDHASGADARFPEPGSSALLTAVRQTASVVVRGRGAQQPSGALKDPGLVDAAASRLVAAQVGGAP